jgi:hypothetical protein
MWRCEDVAGATALTVCRSALAVCRSAFAVNRSAFAVCHSALAVNRSPFLQLEVKNIVTNHNGAAHGKHFVIEIMVAAFENIFKSH